MEAIWRESFYYFEGDKTPVLMLHGFPGESYNGTPFEKNHDIAQLINLQGHAVYQPHYQGLGQNKSGAFSFTQSYEQSLSLAHSILEQHERLIIFGHSWGGYVGMALNLALKDKIQQTILLSPLSYLPPQDVLTNLITSLHAETPSLNTSGALGAQELCADLFVLDERIYPDREQAVRSLKNVTIYHAEIDDEIPLELSQRLVATNPAIDLKVCDTDHGFVREREKMLMEILNKISKK